MGLKNWYNSQDQGVKVGVLTAAVTGGLAIVAAIVTGIFSIVNAEIDHPSQTQTSSQPSISHSASSGLPQRSRPSSALACSSALTLTSPANGTYIQNGANGIDVQGTTCDLGNNSAWLFDWDSQDQYYYADYNGNSPGPLTVPVRGKWSFQDEPIGDPGDNQKEYVITLVSASPSCNHSILQSQSIQNNQNILRFPAGCKIVSKRVVYVSYP